MASNICRFAMLCAFSAGFTAESRREPHPLCRSLDKREQQQPTHFPSAYVCLGDGAGAICTPLNPDSDDASARKEEPGAVKWWVYRGRREHVSGRGEDISDGAWVYCTDYYAHSSPDLGPSKVVGDSFRRRYETTSEHIATPEGFPRETRPGEGGNGGTQRLNGSPRITALSQKIRALQEDEAIGSAGVEVTANIVGRKENARTNADKPRTSLVYAPNATCDDLWLSWPAMQERAIARGTVVVFDVISSVGNLFLIFDALVKFVRLLDLGLILSWTGFPGFREAFNPGAVNWDLDAGPFMQQMGDTGRGANATGLHSLEFRNFAMVLSDSQLELLALTLNINETNTQALANHFREELPNRMNIFMGALRGPLGRNSALNTQPCTWNMLLSRSPSVVASLEEHSPWGMLGEASGPSHQTADYIAWHIRTTDGETSKSYNPSIHKYVVQEPSSEVCPAYLEATEDALQLTKTCRRSLSVHDDDEVVYISSNSKPMAQDCTVEAAKHDIAMGHVDMGLNSSDAHTAHSRNPLQTALGAFLDFFFLLDATVIVRTGSSFSGTVVKIKGLDCDRKVYDSLPQRTLFICLPRDC